MEQVVAIDKYSDAATVAQLPGNIISRIKVMHLKAAPKWFVFDWE
jgi:hypothetical protein